MAITFFYANELMLYIGQWKDILSKNNDLVFRMINGFAWFSPSMNSIDNRLSLLCRIANIKLY